MKRCAIRKAEAAFILADRSKATFAEEAVNEDHRAVLRVWSVRKYAPRTPVFVSTLRPETEVHVKSLSRQVLCVNSIKQIILGYSCLYPGAATLITNLVHQAPPLEKYKKAWQVLYGKQK